MKSVALRIELAGEGAAARFALVRTMGALDPAAYRSFAQILADRTVFVAAVKAKCARVEHMGDVISALRSALRADGTPMFDVALAPTALDALHAQRAEQWLDKQSVDDRIRSIGRLFSFQVTGTRWLAPRARALLADEMGTGKTIQTIAALPAHAPCIVVCPSAVKDNWRGQVAMFRPQIPVHVLRGRGKFRWADPGTILVLNYDILPDIHDREGVTGRRCDGLLPPEPCRGCAKQKLVQLTNVIDVIVPGQHLASCDGYRKERLPCAGCHPFLGEVPPGTTVVLDEAQLVKNDKAGRTRAMKAIGRAARFAGGRTWALTGTPIENNPAELWTVLDVLDLAEEAFGSKHQFYDLFKAEPHPSGYGTLFHLPEPDTMKERLGKVMLRRRTADVLRELPDKLSADHIVDINADTIRKCDALIAENGGSIDRFVELLRAKKFPFEIMSAARAALALAKLPAVLEYVKYHEESNPDDPLLVFSAHLAPVQKLAARKGWRLIAGSENEEKKNDAVRAFQAGELKGLAITIRAGGTGITLTRGSTVIFVDEDFNPAANAQAVARAHRHGQNRVVQIKRFVANHPLDRRLHEILDGKEAMIAATVDAAAEPASAGEATVVAWGVEKNTLDKDLAEGERSFATTEAEKSLIEALPLGRWETPVAARVAVELVEEAEAIGLPPGKWALAERLWNARLRTPPPLPPPVLPAKSLSGVKSRGRARSPRRVATSETTDTDSNEPPSHRETTMPKPPNPPRSRPSPVRAVRDTPKRRPGGVLMRAVDIAVDDLHEALEAMRSAEDRSALFDAVMEFLDEASESFCVDCGDEAHGENEICPNAPDEDEDEEEEDGDGKDEA